MKKRSVYVYVVLLLVIVILGFFNYLWYQYTNSQPTDEEIKIHEIKVVKKIMV